MASTAKAEEYKSTLSIIEDRRESVALALQSHGKTHTQFQYALLDNAGPIAGPTKLRNMRQILAVIDRTEAALQEAYFNRQEKMLDIRELEEQAERQSGLQLERTELLIQKAKSELQRGENTITGALRKLAAYYAQHESLETHLKEELGKDEITEADFEADEERFHIMKVFEQALCALRASGAVDHGNMIYFHDIGINGNCAIADLLAYARREGDAAAEATSVHDMHRMECEFLSDMADKFKGCSRQYAERKGLIAGPIAEATLGIIWEA